MNWTKSRMLTTQLFIRITLFTKIALWRNEYGWLGKPWHELFSPVKFADTRHQRLLPGTGIKLTRNNFSRKVREIEFGSWQRWLEWRGWRWTTTTTKIPQPPTTKTTTTTTTGGGGHQGDKGWLDRRRRRRKRRRKRRRRKRRRRNSCGRVDGRTNQR